MEIDYSKLRVERREGIQCVQADVLLQLLDARASAVMRKCAAPGLDPQLTELLRGRLIEIDEITNTLRRQCSSSTTY